MKDESKLWFMQDKDYFRYRRLSEPYSKICVGSHSMDGMTIETAQNFDVFMNVAGNPNYMLLDEKPRKDTEYFWHPINELSEWGYNPFYWSKKILDNCFDKNKAIYIHCDAGANRSICITMSWLNSLGHSLKESALIIGNGNEDYANAKIELYKRNLYSEIIPDKLSEFYKRYNETGYTLEGILLMEPFLEKEKELRSKLKLTKIR